MKIIQRKLLLLFYVVSVTFSQPYSGESGLGFEIEATAWWNSYTQPVYAEESVECVIIIDASSSATLNVFCAAKICDSQGSFPVV